MILQQGRQYTSKSLCQNQFDSANSKLSRATSGVFWMPTPGISQQIWDPQPIQLLSCCTLRKPTTATPTPICRKAEDCTSSNNDPCIWGYFWKQKIPSNGKPRLWLHCCERFPGRNDGTCRLQSDLRTSLSPIRKLPHHFNTNSSSPPSLSRKRWDIKSSNLHYMLCDWGYDPQSYLSAAGSCLADPLWLESSSVHQAYRPQQETWCAFGKQILVGVASVF